MSAISEIVDNGLESLGRYYSVYRGLVVSNEDETNMDRLKIYIPELQIIDWALPICNFGYNKGGFRSHPLPEFNDVVYVSFENGDPGKPLWEWHSWGQDEMPDDFKSKSVCGIVTPRGTRVLIDDETGTMFVEAPDGITIHAEGKTGINIISESNIQVLANDKIIINKGSQCVPRSGDLENVLNKLVKEVDSLRLAFNTHTHAGVTPGPGITSPTTQQVTKPVSTINKTDFENPDFKH